MLQDVQLQLSGGRLLHLREIRQWHVYEGLLEGLPTREMNQRMIAGLLAEQRKATGAEPYLIEPVQQPISYEDRYPFGTPAVLPKIGCVARFTSSAPARDKTKDYSTLVVVWFQEEFGFEMNGAVRLSLEAIDWNALAEDRESVGCRPTRR